MTREEFDRFKEKWQAWREQQAKEKVEAKCRNTKTKKIETVLTAFDYQERKRHFFNPKNPEEEFPDGLYVIEPFWPYELYGMECGEGWKPLVKPVIDYIDNYNKNKEETEQIKILQIKEKFGRLEIYLENTNDEVCELVDHAKTEAYNVCELCGTRDNIGFRANGWVGVCCVDCAKKNATDRKQTVLWKRRHDEKKFQINPDGELLEV